MADTNDLLEHFAQQNDLLAKHLDAIKEQQGNQNQVDQLTKNIPSGTAPDNPQAAQADQNAAQNQNVAPDTSPQTFAPNLQATQQDINNLPPGSLTNPGLSQPNPEVGMQIRGPAGFIDNAWQATKDLVDPNKSIILNNPLFPSNNT